jgi:hypothetical protein
MASVSAERSLRFPALPSSLAVCVQWPSASRSNTYAAPALLPSVESKRSPTTATEPSMATYSPKCLDCAGSFGASFWTSSQAPSASRSKT